MHTFYNILEFLFCLVDVVFLYNFLNTLFGVRKNICILFLGFIVFLIATFTYYFSLQNLFFLPNIILFIFLDVFLSFLFNGKLTSKILYVLLFNFTSLFTEVITVNLLVFLFDFNATEILSQSAIQRSIVGFITKIFLFFSLQFLTKIIIPKETLLPKKITYYMYCIYVFSIFNMLFVFKISISLNDNSDFTLFLLTICIVFIFIISIINILFFELNKYFILLEQNTFIKSKQNSYTNYLQTLSDANEKNNKLMHDVNNHLLNVYNLLKNNNSTYATKYISSIISSTKYTPLLLYSGNEAVDIVISQKKLEAEKYKININVNIKLPKDINISDVHLSSLIFNALDNSIEENKNIEEKFRDIDLDIYPNKNYLYIKVRNHTNNADKSIHYATNKITSKKDKNVHGYGVLIMEDISKQYNGYLDFKTEDYNFILLAALQM